MSGFITYFLASSWLQYFRIFGVVFNAGIVMITILALCSDRKNTLAATAVYACMVDLYASRLLGINLLLYLSVAFLMLHLVDTLYKESITLPYFLFLLSTFVYNVVYFLIMSLFRFPISLSESVRVFLIESIYNIPVGIGMYYLISKWQRAGTKNRNKGKE